jgi:hypothetical protein
MSSLPRTISAFALLLAAGACAPPAPRSQPNPQRYVLTAEELQGAGAQNVYDAIQKLRPEFLRTRGTGTISHVPTPESNRTGAGTAAAPMPANSGTAVPVQTAPLRVYENDVLLDGPTDLRRIQTINVIEIRFVPGPEAGVRYGTNHAGGVLFVKTT